jgi:hypothetical protein
MNGRKEQKGAKIRHLIVLGGFLKGIKKCNCTITALAMLNKI